MNVICISCTDAFLPDDHVYITRCGHIFHRHCLFNWMKGTNTCPECYVICSATDVHRLYLSFANQSSEEEALNNLNMDNKIMRQNHAELEATLSDLRQKVFNDLVDEKNLEMDIANLKAKYCQEKQQQIKDLKEQIQQRKGLRKKYVEAKSLESIQKVLTGSSKDVEEELQNVKSKHELAKMIALLQRDLKTAEDKRKAFRVVLRDSQEENVKLNSENRVLSTKSDILKTRNFNLWDTLLNSKYTSDQEPKHKRETKHEIENGGRANTMTSTKH